nr:26S proteasome non-ATPase regulatory subunit 7 homolog A [Ipomoea batatas]
MSATVERKPSQVELQDANPKAPYIAAVAIVLAVIQTGVDPLGAPVGNRADGGVAIHGGGEDSRNPKINYLHHTLRTDEQIGGLDITMNNLSAVEIIEAGENLAVELGVELKFGRGRMDVIKSQQIWCRPIEKVIVHPLVLLSIVDHYNRAARDTKKRVVGVLLGTSFRGTVDVTNSYAGQI